MTSSHGRSTARLRAGAALSAALALAGCVETMPEIEASATAIVREQIQRRADVSPRGAPVAFASLEGAAPAIVERFATALKSEADSREIVVSPEKGARYVLRGYLDARPVKDGVAVTYVWDVFDLRKTRARRLSDELVVTAKPGADLWASVDETALASVAARSADDLAAFLSNTPEAILAASQASGAAPKPARSAQSSVSEALAQAD